MFNGYQSVLLLLSMTPIKCGFFPSFLNEPQTFCNQKPQCTVMKLQQKVLISKRPRLFLKA